jgi:hypothetical protein
VGATGCESLPFNMACCTNSPQGSSRGGGNAASSDGWDSSNVDQASAPPCTYRGAPGGCWSTSLGCPNGQFRSSHQHANGCQALPVDVQCCISSSNLVDDVYTSFEAPSSMTHSIAPGAIAGIIVGVFIVVALVALLLFFVLRRRSAGSELVLSNAVYSAEPTSPPTQTFASARDVNSGTYACVICGSSYSVADDLSTHVAMRHK